jgi:uncharacterized repeat protein (TIGR03803 family)
MKTVSVALVAGMIGCAFVQPVAGAQTAKYTEKVVWSFGSGADGQNPDAGLIDVNGTLYGTTGNGGSGTLAVGTVFSIDPNTGAETVLYSFCSRQNCTDGRGPVAALIDVNGALYGTTSGGGAYTEGNYGYGTVFSVDPTSGVETVLHSFAGGSDGEMPEAGLIDVNGTLYGTTYIDTVFSLDPNTDAETVLYTFCHQQHCTDGAGPAVGVIDVNGILYGTTSIGGGAYTNCNEMGCGAVFSVDPDTGVETVVHSFGYGADGETPYASLIDVNGTLYGTTYGGGGTHCNCGTVFSLNPKTGKEKVIYAFLGGKDGAYPYAGLINVKGTLYATTYNGGGTGCNGVGCGTVFSIDPKTGVETVLYSFTGGTDGSLPQAGLVNVNGSPYGTTSEGGGTGCVGRGCGTVFVLTKK